ncbi:DUF4105 domain-containing protein [Gammaproteobacteria bacterium]|nr:DUF4105 domain-containing protein [Gammaproteobacteria bacterium]
MKKVIILACLVFISTFTSVAAPKHKPGCSVSLLTCTPGHKIYNLFGHTAIEVQDSSLNVDYVFHYGVFNMYQESFIANFVAGKTDYEIGYKSRRSFTPEYKKRNSIIYQQVINISQQQCQALIDSLFENYKPQNRIYRYNFILDNCATRPFNIIKHFAGEQLKFEWEECHLTYRNIIHEFVGTNNWTQFGIDLVIGSCADTTITQEATLAFPTYLHQAMKQGKFLNDSSSIVAENHIIVDKSHEDTLPNKGFWTPTNSLLLVLLLCILWSIFSWYYPNYHWVLPSIYFIIIGLTGCIITYLAYISSHPLVQNNYNLLWANPLHLIYGLSLIIPYFRKRNTLFSWIMILPILLGFILLFLDVQYFDFSIVLMMLITLLLTCPIPSLRNYLHHA